MSFCSLFSEEMGLNILKRVRQEMSCDNVLYSDAVVKKYTSSNTRLLETVRRIKTCNVFF